MYFLGLPVSDYINITRNHLVPKREEGYGKIFFSVFNFVTSDLFCVRGE